MMEYRNLGHTGLKVSPLCLGAVDVHLSDEEAAKVDEVVAPGTSVL